MGLRRENDDDDAGVRQRVLDYNVKPRVEAEASGRITKRRRPPASASSSSLMTQHSHALAEHIAPDCGPGLVGDLFQIISELIAKL